MGVRELYQIMHVYPRLAIMLQIIISTTIMTNVFLLPLKCQLPLKLVLKGFKTKDLEVISVNGEYFGLKAH